MSVDRTFITFIIKLAIVSNYCDAYKVLLVFPMPGKSHCILGDGYVTHLLEAGHQVTYITPIPIKEPPPGLRQLDVSENFKFLPQDMFDVEKFMKNELKLQDYSFLNTVLHDMQFQTFQLKVIQEFINDPNEKFDVVVGLWVYSELVAGFSTVFNCPFIWSSSMIQHTSVLSLINDHVHPAYTVENLAKHYSFTFWDRAYHLWVITRMSFNNWLKREVYNGYYKQIFGAAVAKRGRQLPHFDDVKYNGSMVLGNTHVATGDSIALPQNYKHIGGYHIKDITEPLPKDLQKVMDDGKDGVIYFSMGTLLKTSKIPHDIKRKLIHVFGELNQTVIWKLEQVIPNLPKNVHVVTWAPQQSILAHPNCILLITHGGLLSMMETINAGVPVIGMPFFADQFLNIGRAAARGFGMRIEFDGNTPENLKIAIKEIIENPRYRQRAKEYSAIFKNNIVPPGKELVYWIEYVIQTKGALHLRSPALHVNWYTKLYLDLILVLFIAIAVCVKLYKYFVSVIRTKITHKKKLS